MSCHSCGPLAADRIIAKKLAEKMVKELTINRGSELGKKLGLKKQIEICCSGMKGYLKRGWVQARQLAGGTPARIYFIIEIRGHDANIILDCCPICGRHIYPTSDKKGGKNEANPV